jgi:hypothetical protein
MKHHLKIALSGATALALAATIVSVGGPSASAAGLPFTPDPVNSIATLALYDATGAQITGGTITDTPFASYAVSSATLRGGGDTKATLFGYLPKSGIAPGAWGGEQLSGSTNFPAAAVGSVPAGATAVSLTGADLTLATLAADFPNTAVDAYQGLYQLRLRTSGGSGGGVSTPYAEADIFVSGTTWTQIYPTVPTIATTTTLAATPATADTTTPVHFTATVGPNAGGTVAFKVDGAQFGTVKAVAGGGSVDSDTATLSAASPTGHAVTATFTPNAPAANHVGYGPSTGNLTYVVTQNVLGTTATISAPTSGTVGTAVAVHVDVTQGTTAVPAGTGKVQLTVDGVATGPLVTITATGADLSYVPLDVTPHAVSAVFTSSNAGYGSSNTNPGVTITAVQPTVTDAKDPQTFIVTAPNSGRLVISTPYTPANPFTLGTLQLSADGKSLTTAPVNFGDPAAPAITDPGTSLGSNGVTVTDTRLGSTGWTASVQTTDFTSPATATPIPGDGLAFSSITPKFLTANNLQAGDVTGTAGTLSAFTSAPKVLATATKGPGTVAITASVSLTAPTSTLPGTYTATVTFTIA